MRTGWRHRGGLAAALVGCAALGVGAQAPAGRTPVLVELFTSEGCSSCPPADVVLTRLSATQPVPGVEVVALGEHVDYWDQEGWRDPFSSPAFSERQAEYTRALHVSSPYTPQMIVNGRAEFIGSDYTAAARVLAETARRPAAPLQLSLLVEQASSGDLPLRVQIESREAAGLRGSADVFVAITEDGLRSHVERGENRGRDLDHTAVVRLLARVGTIAAKTRSWSGTSRVALDSRWRRPAIKIVVFAQDRARRDVLGIASRALP